MVTIRTHAETPALTANPGFGVSVCPVASRAPQELGLMIIVQTDDLIVIVVFEG
jgi:hypothetical protein